MIGAAVSVLGGLCVLMTAVWVVSVGRRDVSIVDIWWSLAILIAAWVYAAGADHPGTRRVVALAAVSLWALRLAGYLAWRGWGVGEDKRYGAMRAGRPRFRWTSLVVVFWLQAALAWIVSLPLLVVMQAEQPEGLRPHDLVAAVLFVVGFGFEVVGDWQLARFKADPANRGRVCDRGLWRYTRHPNYFGEAVLWWGIWCLAVVAPGAGWTVVSPVLLTWLLLRVSGVRLLESDLLKEKLAYRDYVARTSGFLPMPPHRVRRQESAP